MYLFLGETDDALGRNVRQALEKRGAEVRFLSDPFSESTRFSWRLDSTHTSSVVVFEDGTCLADSDISGVLLRRRKAPEIGNTSSDDYNYIQAEIQAATLGWIWTLPCPVINRLPAWLWYNPAPSLKFWNRLLRANGLPGADCCGPESEAGGTNRDGGGSLGTEDLSMVCDRGCVAGQVVVWNHVQPAKLGRYENALIDFTRCVGLSFIEFAIVKASDGIVKEVNPFPDLSRFCASSRSTITEALAKLFTDSNRHFGPQ
jgi:hypothetical protein